MGNDVHQEKLLTAETTVRSTDRNIDPERTCVHDECHDLIVKQEEDDVLDIIYDGKRSRPPDVVDNDHTKSNLKSCRLPLCTPRHG